MPYADGEELVVLAIILVIAALLAHAVVGIGGLL